MSKKSPQKTPHPSGSSLLGPSQKCSSKVLPTHVTRERALQVANAIAEGKLKAPKVEKDEKLILADSGSAPHIASHSKHFPGATLVSGGERKTFTTATGDPFVSEGTMTIPMESQEGYHRTFTCDDAPVAIPILSTGKLADEDEDSLFSRRGGQLINNANGELIQFQRLYGVYVFQIQDL